VVFKDTVQVARQSDIKLLALKYHPSHNISFEYTIIPGFAITLTPEGLSYLQSFEDISYIEEDQLMHAACTTQSDAIWNLARISTRGAPRVIMNTYTYEEDGTGVRCFIIDSGIFITHNEFAPGRASYGANFVTGEGDTDGNGHGTHIASTVAGLTYGIAKKASVIAVKVLSSAGTGPSAAIIAGVNWVATHGKPNKDTANLSLGGGLSPTLDQACNNLVSRGIFVAVAVLDGSCSSSPARASNVFAVGSLAVPTPPYDEVRFFASNATCIKAFAPAESIRGAWIGSETATMLASGSSLASGHVAGIATLILTSVTQSPYDTRDQILTQANKGTIRDPGPGAPNMVIFEECPGN